MQDVSHTDKPIDTGSVTDYSFVSCGQASRVTRGAGEGSTESPINPHPFAKPLPGPSKRPQQPQQPQRPQRPQPGR
jgi:hypothetical protein